MKGCCVERPRRTYRNIDYTRQAVVIQSMLELRPCPYSPTHRRSALTLLGQPLVAFGGQRAQVLLGSALAFLVAEDVVLAYGQVPLLAYARGQVRPGRVPLQEHRLYLTQAL